MQYRTLGRTKIQVSEIGFGGVEIGIPYGIGVEHESQLLDEAAAVGLLRRGLDNGINLFDTAPLYGRSERIIGDAFRDCRDRVVLATKCLDLWDDNRLRRGPALKAGLRRELTDSLKTLHTDYIDIYYLHRVDQEVLESADLAETFAELKHEGLIRCSGLSLYDHDLARMALESGRWDVLQVGFNLMDQRLAELFELAQKQNVALIVRSVLLKGILSDRGRQLHPKLKAVEDHRLVYEQLLTPEIPTLPHLATVFALSHEAITAVLVGIDREAYLDHALAVLAGPRLDGDVLRQIRSLAFPDPAFIDLSEWRRQGWLP